MFWSLRSDLDLGTIPDRSADRPDAMLSRENRVYLCLHNVQHLPIISGNFVLGGRPRARFPARFGCLALVPVLRAIGCAHRGAYRAYQHACCQTEHG
jgi:hypothetical protein